MTRKEFIRIITDMGLTGQVGFNGCGHSYHVMGVPTVPAVVVQIPVRQDDDHTHALNHLTRLIASLTMKPLSLRGA